MDLRHGPADDRLRESFVGNLQIHLILEGRHPQRIAVVAEALPGAAVFGEPRAELDGQPEQVLHGPLVLATGEPAEEYSRVFGEGGPTLLLQDPARDHLP